MPLTENETPIVPPSTSIDHSPLASSVAEPTCFAADPGHDRCSVGSFAVNRGITAESEERVRGRLCESDGADQ